MCAKCGCVIGSDTYQETHVISKTNLYQDYGLGSKPNSNLVSFSSKRYTHFLSTELSMISNICETLNLPKFLSQDIFYWYKKMRKNIKMTKSKTIVLVIYQLCRYNQIPLDEDHLIRTIQMVLHVKNVHSSLNVISESNSFLDDNGEQIIQKIGFKDLTSHNINFMLRSKLKSLYNHYPEDIVSKVEIISKSLIPSMSGSNEKIVKDVIKIAKRRCGIC